MLQLRVETELNYAVRLEKIYELPRNKFMDTEVIQNSPLKSSVISEEIACFKNSSMSRARQAAEVAENVQQDCILPLKALILQQTTELNKMQQNVKTLCDQLHQIDKDIKQNAISYF
jgi:uncharacterized coiled-coil protein SlyX